MDLANKKHLTAESAEIGNTESAEKGKIEVFEDTEQETRNDSR